MKILLDNNNISDYSFIQEGMNSFGYDSLDELFFDVFHVKSNNIEFVKEKKGDFGGNPIVEMDLQIKNEIYKNVRFVLTKENVIKINPNLLDYTKTVVYESTSLKETQKPFKRKSPKIIKESKEVKKQKTLIEKTKDEFFSSIKDDLLENLKEEIKAGIISDLIKENLQSNFDSVITDNGNRNKLQRILENYNNSFRREYIELAEKIARRESLRFAESGGGTNALQLANGGTIDGDLNITKTATVRTIVCDDIKTSNGQTYTSKQVFTIIGDGESNTYNLVHNFDSLDLSVTVYDATNNEKVLAYVRNIDSNTTLIDFHNVIPLDQEAYRVVIFS